MKYYNLSEGNFKTVKLTENEMWEAFHWLFSDKSVNDSSYKFIFLKSIIDCMDRKDEFDKIGEIKLNPLFPHTSLFLTQHCLGKYIINDEYLFDVQRIPKRGGHNKFKAFTIEYPSLIDAVYKSGYISMKCKKHILNDILFYFLPTLLFNKYVARIECFIRI